MADIWESIKRGKALGRLWAFIGVIAVFLVWYQFQDHSPRVKVEQATASVLEVKETGWQVKLGTGETLWIYAAPGVTTKEGDVIPVLIETYESGNRRVELDKDRWMAGG